MNSVHTIPVRAPFPWEHMLRYLALRHTPLVETVHDGRYVRALASGGALAVAYDSSAGVLRCTLSGACPEWRPRLERLFDTAHDPRSVRRVLRRCPVLGPRLRQLPGLRVPGCWEPFELGLRVILGQQVSVKAAHTLMQRLAARCPGLHPAAVAAASLDGLGITGARIRAIHHFAASVAGGSVHLEGVPWEQTAAGLAGTPGFGPWTLGYLAIRLGRCPDAFPETDLGLLRATSSASPRDLLRLAESWRPFRAYAAMYCWNVEANAPR